MLTTIFSEDFEGLTLGPNVDETVAGDEVWTKTPPEGWAIDDSGVPGAGTDNDGVTEWAGWSFASKDWWVTAAEDQGRSDFTAGMGTVAIADGDEWDDLPHESGNQTTYLWTPEIEIGEAVPGSLRIAFDSSYAADGDQESGVVDVSYDGGTTWVNILTWTRANTPNDKNYDSVSVLADNPMGASTAMFRFGYVNAGNNWWFAIDNIEVQVIRPTILFSEDFEGLELGPNVDETVAGDAVWTKTPPEGWAIDDSGVPGAGTDNDGVTEWAGWSFASKDWWVTAAEDQGRSDFTAGMGTVAIADGDEWDDLPHESGNQTTYLWTPEIALGNILEGSLTIAFDSSYAADGDQESGVVDVSYDGGTTWVNILTWTRANTPSDKNYDSVALMADNPKGAETAMFRFGYVNAGNNWWFAIDNIMVTGTNPFWTEDFEGLALGPNVDETVAGDEVWTKTGPEGWTIDDSGVPGAGTDNDGVTEWAGWSFASKDWWVTAAEDQGRSDFTAGMGTVAIADGDEWDDLPHESGNQTTFLSTPDIDISSIGTPALALTADTTYAADGDQESANVEVSFDGGQTWDELLLWTKANTPNEKNYESILLTTSIPAGAETVRFKFGYIDAGNNWWFAIDNLALFGLNLVQPSLSETSPAQDAVNVDPGLASITFLLDPGTEGVVADSVTLTDAAGTDLPVEVTTTEDGDVLVTHSPSEPFDIGEAVALTLAFTSGSGAELTESLSFTIASADITLTAADQLDIGTDNPGFLILTKVNGATLPNTHQRAEDQLANRLFNEFGDPIDNFADTSSSDGTLEEDGETYLIVEGVINFDQDAQDGAPTDIGEVGGNTPIPGVPFGTNDGIAMEILTYLQLEPGFYQMGFNSDDGFKMTVGTTPRAANAPIIAEFEGGRGAGTTRFNFLVSEAGLYPFRVIWYEGNGGANLEWWSIDAEGNRVLINDVSNPDAIRAFRPTTARSPQPYLQLTSPAAGASSVAADGALTFRIVDGAVQPVNRDSVTITINGVEVTASVTEDPDDDSVLLISYTPAEIYGPGEMVNAVLEYTVGSGDNERTLSSELSYQVSDYPVLAADRGVPADAVDTGDEGLTYRLHQVASEDFDNPIVLPNTIGRAEAQLAGMLPYPNLAWTEFGDGTPEVTSILYPDIEDPTSGFNEGFFDGFDLDNVILPGLAIGGLIDIPSIAVELKGYIELPAGYSRFGINHGGGIRVTIGDNPASIFESEEWVSAAPGAGYVETQFDVVAEEAGFYPIRIVWYQGDQGAGTSIGLEFYSFTQNGERVLINDPNQDSVKVYQTADVEMAPFIEAVAPNPFDPVFTSETIGILLNPGSTQIDEDSISITLNGMSVSGFDTEDLDGRILVTFSVDGFRLAEEYHGIIVEYGNADTTITERWVFQGLVSGASGDLSDIFFEDFDTAELMPNIDETAEFEEAWTRMFDGWFVDATGVPGFASEDADGDGWGDNDGMTEWAGWTFANKDFWTTVDGQRRAEFTNASGVVLVADPDEWDDAAHDDSAANGWFQTEVNSPDIDISGQDPSSLILEFDSSWRPECDDNYRQSARIWVQFDGGEKQQILLWTSCPGPFFKDDNSTNEHIAIPVPNPEGASTMKVYFEMFDAGNDWWWAVDNVAVKGGGTFFLDECAAYEAAGLVCPDSGGGEEDPGAVIASLDGANFTITWENAGTFMIQKRADLNPGTPWTDVMSVNGTSYTEAADGDSAFYRVISINE